MHYYKDERGKRYGDHIVVGITSERIPSNGCIKWLCECIHCGHRKTINGNNLRFGVNKGICFACRKKKRK